MDDGVGDIHQELFAVEIGPFAEEVERAFSVRFDRPGHGLLGFIGGAG